MHVVKSFRSNRCPQKDGWSWKVESENSHRLSCASSASGDMGVNQRHHLQKVSATCEGSTSSLVSRINKRAYFFLLFFPLPEICSVFYIFIHQAGRNPQKAAQYVYKQTCLTWLSMTDEINRSKIPKREKQRSLTAPKYTRGNTTQCRNRPEWLRHFCIWIRRFLGYSFSPSPN